MAPPPVPQVQIQIPQQQNDNNNNGYFTNMQAPSSTQAVAVKKYAVGFSSKTLYGAPNFGVLQTVWDTVEEANLSCEDIVKRCCAPGNEVLLAEVREGGEEVWLVRRARGHENREVIVTCETYVKEEDVPMGE